MFLISQIWFSNVWYLFKIQMVTFVLYSSKILCTSFCIKVKYHAYYSAAMDRYWTWNGLWFKNETLYAALHPDVFWYRLNGMGAQKNIPKKVPATLFPRTFYVKTKWNIVYEYLKTKIFSRKSFPKCIEYQIFLDTQYFGNIFGGFWVSLNYSILNF